MQEYFGLCFYWFWTTNGIPWLILSSVITCRLIPTVSVWLVKCVQKCEIWWALIIFYIMSNGNSFQRFSFDHLQKDLGGCFRMCCSAQLFKVQVNLSWWLALWSQEVASVSGVMKSDLWQYWRIIYFCLLICFFMGWGAQNGWGQHHIMVINTCINATHGCRVPCSLSHFN